MKTTSRHVLMASAVSALLALSVSPVLADSSTTTNSAATTDVNAKMGVSAVDAGKLIGENVYDPKGDKVGEIESVIVDTNGKVTSVVLDVAGWLSSAKLISVPWKNLHSTSDGKITSNMTKEQAQAAADYKYKQDQARGKVQTANGELYTSSTAAGASTTDQTTVDGTTSQTASATMDSSVKNADGSLNASHVIGTSVVNGQDESVGKISEIVLGSSGKPSGVVVDVGGFLGLGTHTVLLDWKQISLIDKNGTTEALVKMSKDELKQMPAYTAK